MKAMTNSGASVAAFFDIDGTLLAPPSLERRLLRYLRWRGALTAADGARWLGRFLWLAWQGLFQRDAMGESAWLAATQGNKAHLAGMNLAAIEGFAALLARRPLEFFPEALLRLEWHAAQGHTIFLVSGTLEPLAKVVTRQLPQCVVPCATRLETAGGRLTGKPVGEAVCGWGKARALERLAAEHRLDLGHSYAYADSARDRWMLERVGHPAAVNPSPWLARLARRRGWPMLLWRRAKRPHSRGGTEMNLANETNESASESSALAAAATRRKT